MTRLLFLSLLTLILVLSGCNGSIRITTGVVDDADYTLLSASLSAPPQPGAGTVTVVLRYRLNATGGVVSPFVKIFDDDDFLRFNDDGLDQTQFSEGAFSKAPGEYVGTVTFNLTCNGDEVVGALDGTGEGHADIFGVNEAEIFAIVRSPEGHGEVTSNTIDLWCEE
jgi:hypothetical protein